MLRKLAVSIATLIALSHSQVVQAEAWFEVEVYVFERQSQSSEQWPDAPNKTKTDNAIDLISPAIAQAITPIPSASAPCTLVFDADANSHCAETLNGTSTSEPMPAAPASVEYRYPPVIPSEISSAQISYPTANGNPVLLTRSQSQFASIINSISRERGTRSLLHMAWQQPMRGKSGSVPIRLFAGKDFSGTYHFDGRKIIKQAQAEPMTNADGTPMLAPAVSPVWELDGTLNIYLSHYLYIETALHLRKEGRKLMPAVPSDATDTSATLTAPKVMTPFLMSVPLEQNRRVKSEEIHYLDHPEMGMVIQIRKMAQPSAMQNNQNAESIQTVGQY
ncbi:peptidoglycan binding protein CsiV [Shewanella sp. NKUCC05_KAH]|uniref:peptidoglycan binding protein CsiV n=1 Tax=Shewanella sp. NKUCC05_KAH TaxID=2842126 RepID=UPI001C5B70AB|nr:peptidoglycan binding protein CsiV [Shewanella sp. NKUCC05_KAH]